MIRLPRTQARALAGLGAALVLFGAAPAGAFPDAPGIISEELQLECIPRCTLCHTRPEGGPGNLQEPIIPPLPDGRAYGNFYSNLIASVGASLTKPEQLRSFIVAFQGPCGGKGDMSNPQQVKCDSDGDGRLDVKELKDGTDPNVVDKLGPYSCPIPRYGCGASSIAPPSRDESNTGRGVGLIAALAAGLALVRRFRR